MAKTTGQSRATNRCVLVNVLDIVSLPRYSISVLYVTARGFPAQVPSGTCTRGTATRRSRRSSDRSNHRTVPGSPVLVFSECAVGGAHRLCFTWLLRHSRPGTTSATCRLFTPGVIIKVHVEDARLRPRSPRALDQITIYCIGQMRGRRRGRRRFASASG